MATIVAYADVMQMRCMHFVKFYAALRVNVSNSFWCILIKVLASFVVLKSNGNDVSDFLTDIKI